MAGSNASDTVRQYNVMLDFLQQTITLLFRHCEGGIAFNTMSKNP
ncbi:hypothetical protein [Fuerstiella marisgermanici]|nr:hypothetical protein [Fuerstiella marisgermanici]